MRKKFLHFLIWFSFLFAQFTQIIACAIAIGVLVHAGTHLACDFPRLVNSSQEKFDLISSDFNHKKPTYRDLLGGVEGVTGISMVILMVISFTLATHRFRKNVVRLSAPFNRLTGFNAFWYSHHLLGVVYILLLVHGTFVFLVHQWYEKTVRTIKAFMHEINNHGLSSSQQY